MTTETDIELLKEKIDSINREAWETRVNDSPRSLSRSQESLELAKSINYRKGIADGLRNIGFCNIRLARNDEAVPLLNEAFSIYEAIHDQSGQALVYEYLGIVRRNKGDFGGSLELLFKALALTENTPVDENHATHYYQLGVTYKHLGDFETALEYFYRAISVCRAINNSLYEAYCINLIGSIYFENGDYLKALDYFLQGLPMRQAGGDKWGEAGSLDNIGFTYLKLNELDKATDYCKQSLAISQSTSDKKGEANALLHLAEIYEQAGDIKRASKFSNESLEIRKARGDKRGEAEVLLFLADLHKKRGDIEDQQIFDWISRATRIADEIKAQDLLSKAYYNLHEYHGQKGNYKESLAQLEAYLQIEKELHKNTISQKVSNLEISHKAEAISQRNKELTELNEQIEKANGELRIEASLERVRTVAMGMKEPADMINVCRMISHELQQLGFKEIRNVQTVIIYPQKHEYLNYQYFTPYDKESIEIIDYRLHPDVLEFSNKMLSSPDAYYTKTFEGEALKVWREYRKQTNQLPDPKLDETTSSHYYFYSIGSGALGVTTYAPLNEEQIDLFKRFRNVFELAYKRFIDIEKALAQAKEAQIEAALERIRARAMAMHSSDELIQVANILREQMGLLRQPQLETSVVNIIDESSGVINNWNAYREPALSSGEIKTSTSSFPINSSELTREMVTHYKSGEKEFTLSATGAKLHEFFEVLMKADPQVTNYTGNNIPEKIFYHFTSFTGGTLLTVSYQPPNEEVKSLQRRAASVFDMAYRRYLDLKKAEAQAREAQIEASLERVRSRSMALQKSEELEGVIKVVFEEWKKLGLELYECNINIVNEEANEVTVWSYGLGAEATLKGFRLKLFDHPFLNQFMDDFRKQTPYHVSELSGEFLKEYLAKVFTETDFKDVPAEYKHATLGIDHIFIYDAYMKYGAMDVVSPVPLPNADTAILIRFAKSFEQTYTRFLDLKKAEANAKEAQIEAGLERVRSRSMAMHKSDELLEVVASLFQQMQLLGFNLNLCNIVLFDSKTLGADYWASGITQTVLPEGYHVPYADHPLYHYQLNSWRNAEPFAVFELTGEIKTSWDEILFTKTDLQRLPEPTKKMMQQLDKVILSSVATKHGLVQAIGTEQLSSDDASILSRFAKVFDQTYTRFLDLQKAEAQAKEAQIEAALEKVRSRSLAMHKSDELKDVIHSVFERLNDLNFELDTAIIIIFKEGSNDTIWWLENRKDQQHLGVAVNYTDISYFRKLFDARKNGIALISNFYDIEEKNELLNYLFDHTDFRYTPEQQKKFLLGHECANMAVAIAKNTGIHITRYAEKSFSEAQHDILKKFSKVFDQAYTRFLDLQKAEAQAREAQIEAALEKVRAKVMTMKSSADLNETSLVFGEQLRKLGIDWQFSYFWLIEEDKDDNTFWITWPDKQTSTTTYSIAEADESFRECIIAWRHQEKIHGTHVSLEHVQGWLDTFDRITKDAGGAAIEIMKAGNFKDGVYYYDAMIKFGSFGILMNRATTDEEKNIQSRFAIEFERAYTRFLDLKKAEAQAREARIETGLERVRSKTMAMHKSEEVTGIAVSLNEELLKLGFEGGSTIIIIDRATGDTEQWTGFSEDKSLNSCYVPYFKHPAHDAVLNAWKTGEKFLVYTVAGDEKKLLDDHYFSTGYKDFPDNDKKWMRAMESVTFSHAFMKYGAIHWGPDHLTEEQLRILQRFAKVFEQSYTRFLDLKRAEAQAREALVEAALERVRARALAMQQPEELRDVAQVLRNEMGALGVEELETSSIYIHGESSQNVECWYALQDPKHTEKKMVSDHFLLNLNETWVGREMKEFYSSEKKQTSIVMHGANRKEWIEYCYKHSPAFSGFYGETIPDRTYHLYKFSHGYIGAAAPGDISTESWKLLSRAASVFSLAYSRFRDLSQARSDLIKLKEEKKRAEDALAELQNTQKQLIQTEKMASLGELTAGIAHEIQNPLNFVNNFSDVSNELIEEMKEELRSGNTDGAIQIANYVKENLDKILHHGKRADGIVKGMLQHSRTSSGTKEPTDINNLADEYLRLAYHGFRAKDKSFSAKFETNFDSNIEKINVVPQDIGRVILNLINNAFYTVNEKKKRLDNGYDPIVTVTTKKIKDKIEISVKDNGSGIPQKVLDKIFQPFFTTKPTGQGTGLGLSLSYDIITKGHHGEIKVDTKEGDGCEFTISLPVN